MLVVANRGKLVVTSERSVHNTIYCNWDGTMWCTKNSLSLMITEIVLALFLDEFSAWSMTFFYLFFSEREDTLRKLQSAKYLSCS